MAVDEAITRTLSEGEGVLRIYRWSRPTLSLGRNQRALDRYDPLAIRMLGAEVVRRPTGGRELLHDRELTYSVILPLPGPRGLRAVYSLVHSALLDALRALGLRADLAPPGARTPSPDIGPCFGIPAEGELLVGGKKLVGSAQVRLGRRLLQHGSIRLAPSSISLAALRADPPPPFGVSDPDPWPGGGSGEEGTTLAESGMGVVSFPRVAALIEAAMAGAIGGEWRRDELRGSEEAAARLLHLKYTSTEWTWRR